MSYNFYFISGRNPASTIQALQQTPKALPEPRPRPVLQLVDQLSPEIAPLTEANVQATTPAPRPRNRDILRQRAESIRDDASIRAPSTRRSRSHRSRSPGRQSTQVTGQESGISTGNQHILYHQQWLILNCGVPLLLLYPNPGHQDSLIAHSLHVITHR